MLEFDWDNQTAAATAMMLFSDEGLQARQLFDQYGHYGELALFSQQQPPEVALPPAPTGIGLNLGVRTYFSSKPSEEEMRADRACRRPPVMARCQADGCGVELTHEKYYHRRHKVCEFHSKASIVMAGGLTQRFCQQCSRFHVLSEFDQEKRSCRRRLADHNRRRRKPQEVSTTASPTAPVAALAGNTPAISNSTNLTCNPNSIVFTTGGSRNNFHVDRPLTTSSIAHPVSSSSPPPLSALATGVTAGLGSSVIAAVNESGGMPVPPATESLMPNVSFLSNLRGFGGHNWFQIGRG